MLKGVYLSTWDGYANLVKEGKRFNGDGTFINDSGTVNIAGSIITDTGGLGGIYTVAPDGTGTISVHDTSQGSKSSSAVVPRLDLSPIIGLARSIRTAAIRASAENGDIATSGSTQAPIC